MHEPLRSRLQRHAAMRGSIRRFFAERGYVEVDTPALAPFLIPEPAIEVFATRLLARRGPDADLWLAPSPELWMKRLLAAGSGDIYQLAHAYRNGDLDSPIHNPEFTILEWYTVDSGYQEAIGITEDLFAHLLASGVHGGGSDRLRPPFHRLRMADAFRDLAGVRLEDCLALRPMIDAAARLGLAIAEDSTWEQAFHAFFLTFVEPRLPRDRPLVLMDYPAAVRTTARPLAGTPWAERWELYVDGVEVVNCYTEETNPERLQQLIREEAERKKPSRVQHRPDEQLARLFPAGFPRCSGAALGVERLEMVLTGETSLEGVILFPVSAILRPKSLPG